jgi:predicted lipoprotein with Yx(FWY)xxD motif
MRMALRTLVAGLGLILVLGGCGDQAGDVAAEGAATEATGGDAAAEPTAEPAPTEPTVEPAPAEETDGMETDASVAVGDSELGEVLVDADGMTLYMFEPDEQGEPTCYDDCAANWPPLVVEGEPAAGEGIDEGLLGTAERTDGSTQVTYDGWPLYYFAVDAEAGDTNGQGVNDVWWVMSPDGAPQRSTAAAGQSTY